MRLQRRPICCACCLYLSYACVPGNSTIRMWSCSRDDTALRGQRQDRNPGGPSMRRGPDLGWTANDSDHHARDPGRLDGMEVSGSGGWGQTTSSPSS